MNGVIHLVRGAFRLRLAKTKVPETSSKEPSAVAAIAPGVAAPARATRPSHGELKYRRWFLLVLPTLFAMQPSNAHAYPGQAVVEGSQMIFGALAVLALIGMILASIFNRQYVREALYSLVATFVLFAVVRWAPQLVTLVQS